MMSWYVTVGDGSEDDLMPVNDSVRALAAGAGGGAACGSSWPSSGCSSAVGTGASMFKDGRLLFRTRFSVLDMFLNIAVGVFGVFSATASSASCLGAVSREYVLPLA